MRVGSAGKVPARPQPPSVVGGGQDEWHTVVNFGQGRKWRCVERPISTLDSGDQTISDILLFSQTKQHVSVLDAVSCVALGF
jgi:hypothetical protein